MKKIFLGLLFIFSIGHTSLANEDTIYCFGPINATIYTLVNLNQEVSKEKKILLNRCENEFQKVNYEITESIFNTLDYRLKERNRIRYAMLLSGDFNESFFNNGLEKKNKFDDETNRILRDILSNPFSKAEIEEHNHNRAKIIKQEIDNRQKTEAQNKLKESENKVKRAIELEKTYGNLCKKYSKGSEQYNNCLIDQDKFVKEGEAKKLALKQGQEKKKAELEKQKKLEEERKQQEINKAQKKAVDDKIKEEQAKLEKMSPDDRRAYNCSEKFGFRKGSDKFKDCVFKIYQAEVELEKLELQKQLLKANIELAKANADRQDRLAQAQTETAKMQSLAAQQQANSARTAETLALLDMSLRLLAPPAAPPINRTTCSFNGRFMNCF